MTVTTSGANGSSSDIMTRYINVLNENNDLKNRLMHLEDERNEMSHDKKRLEKFLEKMTLERNELRENIFQMQKRFDTELKNSYELKKKTSEAILLDLKSSFELLSRSQLRDDTETDSADTETETDVADIEGDSIEYENETSNALRTLSSRRHQKSTISQGIQTNFQDILTDTAAENDEFLTLQTELLFVGNKKTDSPGRPVQPSADIKSFQEGETVEKNETKKAEEKENIQENDAIEKLMFEMNILRLSATTANAKLHDKELEIGKLKITISSLEASKDALLEEHEEANKLLSILEEKVEKNKSLSMLAAEAEELRNDVASMKSVSENKDSIIRELSASISAEQRRLSEAQEAIEKLMGERDLLKLEVAKKLEDYERGKEELEAVFATNEKLIKENELLKIEMDGLEKSHRIKLEGLHQKNGERMESLESALRADKSLMQRLETEGESKRQVIKNLETRIVNLTQNCAEWEGQVVEMNSAVSSLVVFSNGQQFLINLFYHQILDLLETVCEPETAKDKKKSLPFYLSVRTQFLMDIFWMCCSATQFLHQNYKKNKFLAQVFDANFSNNGSNAAATFQQHFPSQGSLSSFISHQVIEDASLLHSPLVLPVSSSSAPLSSLALSLPSSKPKSFKQKVLTFYLYLLVACCLVMANATVLLLLKKFSRNYHY